MEEVREGCGLTARQRRIALAVFAGLVVLVGTLDPQYVFLLDGSELCVPFWIGLSLLGPASLLAIWAAFSRQPLAVRWPRALGLAASIGLILAWESHRGNGGGPDGMSGVLGTMATVSLLGLLLSIVRRWRTWRMVVSEGMSRECPRESQFGIRHLLMWTTGAALVLALGRWIDLWGGTSSADPLSDVGGLVTLGVFDLFCLVLVLPWIGLILGNGRRWRFAAWSVVLSVLVLLAAMALGLLLVSFDSSAPTGIAGTEIVWQLGWLAAAVETGLLVTLASGLVVLRACGYRLVRGQEELQVRLGSHEPRGARRVFASLVAAMLLVGLVLCWPAWRVELGRQEAHKGQIASQRFAKLGVTASSYRGLVVQLDFPAKQPVSEAVWRLLVECRDGVAIDSLDLSGRHVTDDQLKHLAGLKTLGSLNLADNEISDAGLVHLAGLKEIRRLNLERTKITGASLGSIGCFPGLSSLDLRGTRVSDAGLVHLRGVKSLYELNLCDTAIGDPGVEALGGTGNLAHLYLDGTRITDAGMKHLQKLKNLQVVSFANTGVTEQAKAELSRAMPGCRVAPTCPASSWTK